TSHDSRDNDQCNAKKLHVLPLSSLSTHSSLELMIASRNDSPERSYLLAAPRPQINEFIRTSKRRLPLCQSPHGRAKVSPAPLTSWRSEHKVPAIYGEARGLTRLNVRVVLASERIQRFPSTDALRPF